VQELRAAAEKLRTTGRPVLRYTSPWYVAPGEDGEWLVGYTQDHPLAGLVARTPDYGGMALADWVALMSPSLAGPLADSLEAAADVMGFWQPYSENENGYRLWTSALAIARAINGPTS
jgi:hypothetical protein